APDGKHVYVANFADADVSVIDTATNTVIGSPISVGNFPKRIAIAPDGQRAYVTVEFGAGTVSVIDTATNTVVGSPITVGTNPYGIGITPDGKRAYVTHDDPTGTVTPVDLLTGTAGPPISVGSQPHS